MTILYLYDFDSWKFSKLSVVSRKKRLKSTVMVYYSKAILSAIAVWLFINENAINMFSVNLNSWQLRDLNCFLDEAYFGTPLLRKHYIEKVIFDIWLTFIWKFSYLFLNVKRKPTFTNTVFKFLPLLTVIMTLIIKYIA